MDLGPILPPPPPEPFDLPLAQIRRMDVDRTREMLDVTTYGDLAEGRGEQYVAGRARETWRVEALVGPDHSGMPDLRIHGRRFYVEECSMTAPVDAIVTWSYCLRPAEPPPSAQWEQEVWRGSRRIGRRIGTSGPRFVMDDPRLPGEAAVDALRQMGPVLDDLGAAMSGRRVTPSRPARPEPTLRAKGRALDLEDE